MSNQKMASLIALYLLMVAIVLGGIMLVMPDAPYIIALASAVVASLLICGMVVNIAGQPGGLTAQSFFAASVAANSKCVVVVTSPSDLREVLYQLKLSGLAPVVATA